MQSDSMKILITGANGNLGQQLIQRLCDEPEDANGGAFGVRALVRSERAAKAIRDYNRATIDGKIMTVEYADKGKSSPNSVP